MSAQGAEIQGVQIGDLTPLDYTGTKCWLKTSDGVVFQRTNILKSWTDSTPYGIVFTGADTLGNARATAGGMYQVGNRLGYAAFGGDSWLQALKHTTFSLEFFGEWVTVYLHLFISNIKR